MPQKNKSHWHGSASFLRTTKQVNGERPNPLNDRHQKLHT